MVASPIAPARSGLILPPTAHRTASGLLTQGFMVIQWMESFLVHTEGRWRGQPFRLLTWQKRWLLELFRLEADPEWIPVSGQPLLFRRGLKRRYRQAFLCVPKKNGKTELADALCAFLLIGDGEPSPKGVIAAGSLKQAGLSFRGVSTMLLESPVLKRLVSERDVGDLVIEIPSIPGSRLERVAAEAGTNDGPSNHFGLLDEVHEYPGQQGVKVHGVITNSGAARENPMFVSISTVGPDLEDEDQIWVQLYRRGEAALADPDSDPSFFFHLAQAPPGSDWRDRDVWEAANPSANITVSWSFYQEQWPKGENWCRRYYLNDPPGGAEDPWMQPDDWRATVGDVAFRADLPVFARVQIAHDHRSAAIAIAQRQGDLVALRVRSFDVDDDDEEYVPASALEDYLADLRRLYPARVLAAKRYSARGREHQRPTAGPEISYHGAFFEASKQRLEAGGAAMIDIPNSQERLAPASETLMGLVVDGNLVHDGDPELARQVGRVVAKQAAKGWAIQPPSGTRARIVAALAAMHAVHRAMNAPRPPSRALHVGHR